MHFSARVHVALKPTVNDPQGNAVLSGLQTLGFNSVHTVRVGKYLTLELEARDKADASKQVSAMCEKLLANTVIETYAVDITPG